VYQALIAQPRGVPVAPVLGDLRHVPHAPGRFLAQAKGDLPGRRLDHDARVRAAFEGHQGGRPDTGEYSKHQGQVLLGAFQSFAQGVELGGRGPVGALAG